MSEVVTDLWGELGATRSNPVIKEHRPYAAPERWWSVALGLPVITDEACADLSYGTSRQFSSTPRPSS